MKKYCIIIPVYKEFKELSIAEKLSLTRVFEVFGKTPIYFFGPQKLEWKSYSDEACQFKLDVGIKMFDRQFFNSVKGYNELLTSESFYTEFKIFDYCLLYQLDAWVFRNELDYWSNAGYDYLGAPWFEGWHLNREERNIVGVGNGGFSLRNIKKFIGITQRISFLNLLYKLSLSKNVHGNIIFRSMLFLLHHYLKISDKSLVYLILKPNKMNEDYFWCMVVGKLFSDFQIAPVQDAIKFSFEVNPDYLYKINNEQLPFGCHAWERYNPIFWKQFIKT